MSEQLTEREKALAARVAELEAASKAEGAKAERGGMIEAAWQMIKGIVPAPLAVAALAVFVGHHGIVYYVDAQAQEAETALKAAKADVEKASADAANMLVDGSPLRLQQVEAELKQKQEQAKRARAEADALNAKEKAATLRIETIDAEIEGAQQKAAVARAQADAKNNESGLGTLEQRAARAKLDLTEIEARKERWNAALLNNQENLSIVCEHNKYAAAIGCPAQYVRAAPPVEQPQAAPSDAANGAPAQYRTINTENANLRSCAEPSNSRCPPVATIPQGFRVKILGAATDNGWFQVEARDNASGRVFRGYMNGKYLDPVAGGRQSAAPPSRGNYENDPAGFLMDESAKRVFFGGK